MIAFSPAITRRHCHLIACDTKRFSPMDNVPNLPSPTNWPDNPYQDEWADRDFLYSADGIGEFPKHACKMTYLLSRTFIRNFRKAIDVGCRVGEFTRYLQRDFQHVNSFDPNLWPNFRYNV